MIRGKAMPKRCAKFIALAAATLPPVAGDLTFKVIPAGIPIAVGVSDEKRSGVNCISDHGVDEFHLNIGYIETYMNASN
jgi:hypothetical protein